MWTRLYDMNSGGSSSTPYEEIYIEGNEDQAAEYMEKNFSVNIFAHSCPCCDDDYCVEEGESIYELADQSIRFYGLTPEEFFASNNILIVGEEELYSS